MTSPNEILSQDEVDALLKGVNGEPAESEAAESAFEDGVRAYDFDNPERIVRGRLPTLEIINDRFARLARMGLYNLMRQNPDVTPGQVKVQKFADFKRNLVVPTNLNIVQVKPLRGMGLVVFDPALVMAVVDTLFGGDGRFHVRVEGRDFTAVEQRIIERLLGVVLEEYTRAWEPVFGLSLEFVRSEMNTQFANIASAGELVVTSSFTVDMGSVSGAIHVCIPYSTLEPIRDILASLRSGGEADADQRWLKQLSKQVQLAEVQLSAPLARVPATMGDLMKMKAGDVIPFELSPNIVAEVEGVPILDCRFGTSGGRYALKVNRVMAVPKDEHHGE
jgi:flagellar motor switch protein FliM